MEVFFVFFEDEILSYKWVNYLIISHLLLTRHFGVFSVESCIGFKNSFFWNQFDWHLLTQSLLCHPHRCLSCPDWRSGQWVWWLTVLHFLFFFVLLNFWVLCWIQSILWILCFCMWWFVWGTPYFIQILFMNGSCLIHSKTVGIPTWILHCCFLVWQSLGPPISLCWNWSFHHSVLPGLQNCALSCPGFCSSGTENVVSSGMKLELCPELTLVLSTWLLKVTEGGPVWHSFSSSFVFLLQQKVPVQCSFSSSFVFLFYVHRYFNVELQKHLIHIFFPLVSKFVLSIRLEGNNLR